AQTAVVAMLVGAVVGAEKDKRVFPETVFLQRGHDFPDALVHFRDHFAVGVGNVIAFAVDRAGAADLTYRYVVWSPAGIVRGLVGEVETEGTVLVFLDETDAMACDQVGGVALLPGRLDAVPPVLEAGLVDVGEEIHVAAHITDELAEPVVDRVEFRIVAEV